MPRYLTYHFHGHDFFSTEILLLCTFSTYWLWTKVNFTQGYQNTYVEQAWHRDLGTVPIKFYQEYKQNLFLPKTLYCYVPTKILDIPVALLLWTGFCRSLLQICYFCKLTLLVMKKPTSQFSSLCIQSRWLLDLVWLCGRYCLAFLFLQLKIAVWFSRSRSSCNLIHLGLILLVLRESWLKIEKGIFDN